MMFYTEMLYVMHLHYVFYHLVCEIEPFFTNQKYKSIPSQWPESMKMNFFILLFMSTFLILSKSESASAPGSPAPSRYLSNAVTDGVSNIPRFVFSGE